MKTSTKVYLGFTLATLAGSSIAIVLLRRHNREPEVQDWTKSPPHPRNLKVDIGCEYCGGMGKKLAVSMEGYGDFEYDCKMCNGTGTRTIVAVEGKEVALAR